MMNMDLLVTQAVAEGDAEIVAAIVETAQYQDFTSTLLGVTLIICIFIAGTIIWREFIRKD